MKILEMKYEADKIWVSISAEDARDLPIRLITASEYAKLEWRPFRAVWKFLSNGFGDGGR